MYIAPRAVGRGAKNYSLFFQRERIYCNITLYPRYLFVSGLFVFFEANNPTTQTILLLSAYVWRTCRMVSDEELRVSIEVSLKRTSASTALWMRRMWAFCVGPSSFLSARGVLIKHVWKCYILDDTLPRRSFFAVESHFIDERFFLYRKPCS